MNITIRKAELYHLAAICRIEEENFPSPAWSQTFIEGKLQDPGVHFLVSEAEGKLLGYAVVQYMPPEAELLNIAIDRPFQGKGIGRQLVSFLLEEGRAQGLETIYLEARASNTRALTLYRSLGFQQTGLRKNYYQNPEEDAMLMAKTL